MAIINEGYFPQNSQTVCKCVSAYELQGCVRVCVCVGMADGGEQHGVMSLSTLREFNCEMHIGVEHNCLV